jgi:ATP-dependent phosphofructokinase / diphosphate-dependent phosphofructokinase
MRIGLLTGGGDVPGLNPAIKAVVNHAEDLGWEVVGFRRGWAGPLGFDPDDDAGSRARSIMTLNRDSTRTIDRSGGTILHTSRTNPGKVRPDAVPAFLKGLKAGDDGTIDCTPHVLRVLNHLGIDALIPIGGDDTLSYAARLHTEGVPVMSIPKTMDNDVYGTDYCIGFSTAVSRSVEFVHALRTPTGSHERIAVIELFGRNSGETALLSGFLGGADRTLISEVPFDIARLTELVMADRERNPSHYAIVVVSEGASFEGGETLERGGADAYGHRKLGGIGAALGEELKRRTGVGIVAQTLGYLMRAGPPDSLDRMVAAAYGAMAVQRLSQKKTGEMMALIDGKYDTVPVDMCLKGTKRVDINELYDTASYRPRLAHVKGKPMFLY